MELKEFLENNPILVKVELASQMYPNLTRVIARNKLHNKIAELESGTGTQKILPQDLEAAKKVLKILRDNIDEFLK